MTTQGTAPVPVLPQQVERFPSTRYLGSKRRLLPFLHTVFSSLEFETAADPFCGTGAVAFLLKAMGRAVTASDSLRWNAMCAEALLRNDGPAALPAMPSLLRGIPDPDAPAGFVERHFDGIFFEPEENRFIDQVRGRLRAMEPTAAAPLWYALFQAALAKRPYNLFHRANLSLRRSDVRRSFGNKTTWDTPFPTLMERFANEADGAVFRGEGAVTVRRADVDELDFSTFDLVYLDPPYMPSRGVGVDYADYYHFLEGLCLDDGEWEANLLPRYRHRPLRGRGTSLFCRPDTIGGAIAQLVARIPGTVVISYRSDGIPSIEALAAMLKRAGRRVEIRDAGSVHYALSTRRTPHEVALIGRPDS